ncbi:TraB/GumN family protein [Mucilaginibacter lutimaris]|uniref:TraB/GumN family protein n=1 Tax=Mucilaginibacter lutimaris TaxID=931629 RepID=A0ABW2ZDI7_9SPHI
MTTCYTTKSKLRSSHVLKLRNLVIAVILCATSVGAAAQQKPGYSLLWKISGKGLTKPSYIFGTMHVKDKRVFGFSDSVMLAIQSCPAFALEIHPDTVIKQMFEDLGNKDTKGSLRKLLSNEDYEKFAKRFEAKNGYPPGDIDPIQAESMMQAVKEKPDDKKAFVDAYLFGVARGMGKNIIGLENTREQIKELGESDQLKSRLQDILDGDEQEELEQTEEMIRLYSAGNLKEIVDYLGDDHLDDPVLIARNNVMVNNILKQIATEPLFSAIGVAHLPGDNGLITLLRNAGYTVTPVTATFTGIADNFNSDYTNLKWKTYTDEEQGYSINFPFEPIKTSPSYDIKAVVYPDMGNEMFLGTYALLNGPKSSDQAIARILKNIRNKEERIISNKVIMLNGIKATEVIVENKKHITMRYRFITNNNFLYCIYAGNDITSVNSAYANKFFNSFKSFKPAIKPDKKWITYKNDTAAFSVDLPMQPVIIKQHIASPKNPDNTFELSMYLTTDSVNFINYLVRYNDYPKGTYLANKTQAFESVSGELKSKGAVIKKIRTIFLQGYEGREFEFSLKQYSCKAQFFIRGNRIYLLLKQNLEGGEMSKGFDFFKTLKFTPYAKAPLNSYEFKNGAYTTKVFQNVVAPVDSSMHYNSYLRTGETVFSTNMRSGGVFGVEHATFSKYYRIANIDSAYSKLLHSFVNYTDSLIKKDSVTVNGIKGWELITQGKYTKEKERRRLIINNNDVFTFMSHAAEEELFSDDANEFYNSLTATQKTSPISLSASKAKLIIKDLSSTDTTTYNFALGALTYYEFEKSDLNDLLSAIQKNYSDDTTDNGARVKLIEAIANLKEPSSADVLVKVFNDTKSEDIKVTALNAIVKVDSIKGYNTYFNLLSKETLTNASLNYQIFRPLNDSLGYVAANFPEVIKLLKHPGYRRNILSIAQNMAGEANKGKYLPLIRANFNVLTQYANEDLKSYLADTAQYKWKYGISNYLQLMTAVKGQPLTDGFTSAIIKKDAYDGEVSEAVITRLDNGLAVNTIVTNRLLDSISLRYGILEALNRNGKLNHAPLKYRSQLDFAKTSLYEYVQGEDEGSATNIKLLGIIPENQNQYFVFKFDSGYNEDAHYTAICGPYKTGSAKLDFSIYRVYTDWDDKQTNWKLHARKMIPKLKEANKESLKYAQN